MSIISNPYILKNANKRNTKFMEQAFVDFDTSGVIAFVLTIFSTIIAIVPMIELPGNDHSSDEIYRLRAAYTIMNSSNNNNNLTQTNQLLWAYNMLHDPNHVIYYYNKLHMPYYNKELPPFEVRVFIRPNDPITNSITNSIIESNLAMAVANYNSLTDTTHLPNSTYLQNLPNSKDDNLQNEIWFTNRTVHLEKPLFNHSEDASCTQIQLPTMTTVCSRSNLSSITSKIDDLTQKGFVSNFYNTKERVHALENPVETYVTYLNHFIIISLVAGPITYIAAKRYYIKHKDG